MAKLVSFDAPSDKIIIIYHIDDALIPMIGADIFDLVHTVFLAADEAFQTDNMFHDRSPDIKPLLVIDY